MDDALDLDALIQSEAVREYVLKTGWTFTDAQRAALIVHGHLPLERRFWHLRILRDQTNDADLKEQLISYLDRTERDLRDFKENHNKSCIYLLKAEDEEHRTNYCHISPMGYFFDWELAHEYGCRTARRFQIEKLHIANNKVYIADSNQCAPSDDEPIEQDDDSISCLGFNQSGEAVYFEAFQGRSEAEPFVNAFFRLPNPFERGDIVRRLDAEQAEDYGIIETSQEQCRKNYERWEKGTPFHMEFGDDCIRVAFLCNDGTFGHEHSPALYLERYRPQRGDSSTEKGAMDNLLLCASEMYSGTGSLDELWFYTMEYRNAKNHKTTLS